MRILVDIVHPAHALFFLRPIRTFLARGDTVTVASRHKDVTCALLDDLGVAHTPISRAGTGLIALGAEMIARDAALWRLVRRVRPQVMLGFGGVAIAHVGRVTGVPSVAYYDSENARLQTRLAYPFLTRLVVPEDYAGPTPAGRTRRLPGTKDLGFFHPRAFRPDRDRALAAGLDPDRPNILLRLVSWRANHDLGKAGLTGAQAADLAQMLAPRAALHVSAEGAVPPALTPFLWTGRPADIHHLMGFCDVVAGESLTMAREAIVMGVPAIYAGVDFPGVVRGMARRGLMRLLAPGEHDRLAAEVLALLERPEGFVRAREAWLAECPDWAEDVVASADALARPPW